MPVLSDDREGVGLGVSVRVGVGVGVGAGGGGGGAPTWACADVDANASVSAKASANAVASLRPTPILLKCEGLAEPRINIIPKKARLGEKYQNPHRPRPICAQFVRSVNRSWSPPPADCRSMLFRCHRSRAGDLGVARPGAGDFLWIQRRRN
jgi:hypothetical protein